MRLTLPETLQIPTQADRPPLSTKSLEHSFSDRDRPTQTLPSKAVPPPEHNP